MGYSYQNKFSCKKIKNLNVLNGHTDILVTSCYASLIVLSCYMNHHAKFEVDKQDLGGIYRQADKHPVTFI